MKAKILEIFKNKGFSIDESELENLGEAIQETLEAIADKIDTEEPYAVNTIQRYREVGSDVVEYFN